MDKNIIKQLANRYNILPEKVEIMYPLTIQYDVHLYDVLSLYDIYKEDKYVIENIKKRQFANKVENWLNGNYKLYNVDRFRKSAINFEKEKRYTNLTKNKHPNSVYMKHWREEIRRSLYGYYVDNEWITGYHYFYLNYTPIDKVESIDNIRADRIIGFPAFWDSDFFYFHYLEMAEQHGLNGAALKTRGRGYTWKGSSMCNRNFYLIPRSRSVIYASSNEFLTGQDGILTKTWSQMTFIDKNTPWSKRRQKKDTDTYKRASLIKKVNGVNVEDGFLSEIAGVTLKDDPHKSRGKRAKLIIFEEAGSFKDIIQSWIISEPSVKQGRSTFGLKIAYGTGGEEGESFEGLYKFFYKPESFNIYSLPNFWSKGGKNNNVAWFQPEYMNREGFYDKNGNSDIDAAINDINEKRSNLINVGADPETILRTKAESPIVPEDALLRTSGSPFPRALLNEQLIRLQEDNLLGESYKGKLIYDKNGKITWMEDDSVILLYGESVNNINRKGGIELYEKPIETVKNTLNGYIMGVDPIDFDYNEIGDRYSLGSCFVMNTFTNNIVAEYTGRPDLAIEFYENVKRLAIYYNAKVMVENNIKGLIVYFINQMHEYYLAEKPKILDDSNIIIKAGNRKYGFTANERTNKFGLELIKKWLTEPLPDMDNMNRIYTIRSKGLLNELLNWNPDGNFDRISAMSALMIFYQDIERLLDNMLNDTGKDEDYKFWSRPFK